jgi:hypothetical protein
MHRPFLPSRRFQAGMHWRACEAERSVRSPASALSVRDADPFGSRPRLHQRILASRATGERAKPDDPFVSRRARFPFEMPTPSPRGLAPSRQRNAQRDSCSFIAPSSEAEPSKEAHDSEVLTTQCRRGRRGRRGEPPCWRGLAGSHDLPVVPNEQGLRWPPARPRLDRQLLDPHCGGLELCRARLRVGGVDRETVCFDFFREVERHEDEAGT